MNWLKRNGSLLIPVLALIVFYFLFLRRPTDTIQAPGAGGEGEEETYRLVTLLPKDAIPAIDDPRFYNAADADREYAPDELVLGVSIDGDSRAYSTPLLSSHEIVNDVVGGRPIAVTW